MEVVKHCVALLPTHEADGVRVCQFYEEIHFPPYLRDLAITSYGGKPIDGPAAWSMARMVAVIFVLQVFCHFTAFLKLESVVALVAIWHKIYTTR